MAISGFSTLARCACLTALFYTAQPVLAQSATSDTSQLSSARAVLISIPLGARLRILTIGQSIIEGRLATRSDTGIVIRQRDDSSRVSIARIAVIYRPAPNYKSGAIIGGLTGGALGGLLLGTFAAGICERSDCSGAFGEGAAYGVVFGGGLGALLGLFIGSVTHHWKRAWP